MLRSSFFATSTNSAAEFVALRTPHLASPERSTNPNQKPVYSASKIEGILMRFFETRTMLSTYGGQHDTSALGGRIWRRRPARRAF